MCYIKCESFTVISVDTLLVHKNKYYLQVCLDTFAYSYLGDHLFLIIRSDKCCILIKFIQGVDIAKSNN